MQRYPLNSKSYQAFNHSISAAKRFVSLFHHIQNPDAEQLTLLAAAHYTLGLQKNISVGRAKMQLNSAITLLHNVPAASRKSNWYSLMANAYIKRAELLEQEDNFVTALMDYKKAIEFYEARIPSYKVPDFDRLLLAQAAISIADLTVNEQMAFYTLGYASHPLFYVNKALEYLSRLSREQREQDEVWTTLAYAHQIAGIALTPIDLLEATEAFRTAILMAFKSEPKSACQLLGDIYNSMGLLYEQHFQRYPIQKVPLCLSEQATIYFNLALIFSPSDTLIEQEDDAVDIIFETIYRALDPFPTLFSPTVMRDLIDALIFIYYCITDNSSDLQEPFWHLNQPEILKLYAQHIYWLVTEYQRREDIQSRLLEYANPSEIEIGLDLTDILPVFTREKTGNNVHYLYKEERILEEQLR